MLESWDFLGVQLVEELDPFGFLLGLLLGGLADVLVRLDQAFAVPSSMLPSFLRAASRSRASSSGVASRSGNLA